MYNGGYMSGGMGMNPGMGGYGGTYGAGAMGGYGGGMGAGYVGRGMGGRGMGRGAGGSDYGNGASSYGGGGYHGGRGGGGGGGRQEQQEFVEGKLFLGGLDTTTTKDTLVEYCQQWGELADYVLMEGRGFGFVTFKDPAGAQTFLEHREHIIDGKRVEAKAAMPRNSSSGSSLTKKMFVGGTGEVDDADFRNYFEQFGEIEDCVVLRKPDGGSRGFGFVTYKDEISVEKCLVMQHQLNGKTVELKRAIKKEEMGGGGYGAGGGFGASEYGSDAGGYSTGGTGGPMRTGKAHDWVCPNTECRNKNFGWRQVCNRCQLPKPANPELAPARPGTSSGSAGGYNRSSGGYDAMGGMGAMSMGMGGMGMPGMGGMGYGMGGMGYGMGGMGMGGGMGMAGYGSQGGYGGASGYGSGSGYGRASGRGGGGGGGQGRYRPY